MATIFLSHSSRDNTLAAALEAWLRANEFDDLFIDNTSIRSGDKWTEALRRAKASCRVVLCLVTPHWLASDECFGEFSAAWYMGRRIVPLMSLRGAALDDKQKWRLSRVLGEDQGADLANAGAPEALDLDAAPAIAGPLRAGLRAAGALAKVGLDPFAFEVDRDRRPEPFPGLESFSDDDADAAIFFGRGPEIAQCLEDLREMRASGDARAYAIQGASGSGKSSLMKAGLLPRLRREQGWLVLRAFRPGADPLLNFAEAIARTGADWGEAMAPGAVRDRLLEAWRGKADLRAAIEAAIQPLKLCADKPAATVLIALDQAEELARAAGESADVLAAYLKAALTRTDADEPAAYAVALTVRSDSFAELQAAPRFEGLPTRTADIRALPVHRFAGAIEQPAARYGVEIEPALVETLIEDAGGKDALPLLAFTLQRLWRQYQSEKRIVKANYDSVGKLSGLIEDAAERALRGVDPLAPQGPLEGKVSADRARRAGQTFVPALAQVNERGAAIRRVTRFDAFDEDGQELLGQFDRWRLVVKTGELVEVAHESMFREWPRFSGWLAPEKARLEALRGVESAAAAWVAKGRKRDDLLHRGRRLAEARGLDKVDDYRRQLDRSPDARAYLAACGDAERGRRLWVGASVLATLAAVVGLYWLMVGRPEARSVAIAAQLQRDFYTARQHFHDTGQRDFSKPNRDIAALLAIDRNSGHALYYQGEIVHMSNPAIFYSYDCVKPIAKGANLNLMDYEAYLLRYLDVMKSLPSRETGGGMSVSVCYARPGGYCPQRTAWVDHILANDLYAEALAASDVKSEAALLRGAHDYAEKALALYGEPGQARGFVQCVPTEDLAARTSAMQTALAPKP